LVLFIVMEVILPKCSPVRHFRFLLIASFATSGTLKSPTVNVVCNVDVETVIPVNTQKKSLGENLENNTNRINAIIFFCGHFFGPFTISFSTIRCIVKGSRKNRHFLSGLTATNINFSSFPFNKYAF